jgi:hypothetical protein
MSWTNECTESNYFKVKNTDEVREVFELMGYDVYVSKDNEIEISTDDEGGFLDMEAEVVLSLKPISIEGTEKNLIGIISDCLNSSIELDDLEKEYGVTKNEVQIVPVEEYLQDQLLNEKEYIAITCAGFECRCSGSHSPFGEVTIITKNEVWWSSLASTMDEYLAK